MIMNTSNMNKYDYEIGGGKTYAFVSRGGRASMWGWGSMVTVFSA
jgi:hypothetical protein